MFWTAVALQREIEFPNETWDQSLWVRTFAALLVSMEEADPNIFLNTCQAHVTYASEYGIDEYRSDLIGEMISGGELADTDIKGNYYEVAFLAAFDAWDVRVTNEVRQLAIQQAGDYQLSVCTEILG